MILVELNNLHLSLKEFGGVYEIRTLHAKTLTQGKFEKVLFPLSIVEKQHLRTILLVPERVSINPDDDIGQSNSGRNSTREFCGVRPPPSLLLLAPTPR